MGGSLKRKRFDTRRKALRPTSSSLKVCAGDLCGRLQEGRAVHLADDLYKHIEIVEMQAIRSLD